MLITRKVMNLQDYITLGHIEAMNKIIVLTGSIVGCAYLTELFMAWYGANTYEYDAFFKYRLAGPYGWSYWIMMTCNVVSPQLFWFKKLRGNIEFTFIMSVVVSVGMWFERFVIIVTSFTRLSSFFWSLLSSSIYEIGFYGYVRAVLYLLFPVLKIFSVIIYGKSSMFRSNRRSYKAKWESLKKHGCGKFLC